jgi:hypothetical protein
MYCYNYFNDFHRYPMHYIFIMLMLCLIIQVNAPFRTLELQQIVKHKSHFSLYQAGTNQIESRLGPSRTGESDG